MTNVIQKFTSSGTISFPAGVVRARVRGYGGGGGGGGGAGANLDITKGAGGGGGGCAVWQDIVIAVAQGISYTVTVGAGGIGGTAGPANTPGGDGYAGGNSKVSNGATNLCLFVGASGGQHGAVGTLGKGGLPITVSSANALIGDNANAFDAAYTLQSTLGAGGPGNIAPNNGGIGTAFMNPSIGVGGSSAAPWYVGNYGTGSAGGGGGGGAAGPGGNGGDGGNGGVGGGAGSPGVSAAANSGAGGGGGGGGGSSAAGAAGGNGGSGYIEIEYTI